jgi:hypothetical protein
VSESGAPKRDTPDNEDFEGTPKRSDQQPEEAPPEVAEPGKPGDEKRKGQREKEDRG